MHEEVAPDTWRGHAVHKEALIHTCGASEPLDFSAVWCFKVRGQREEDAVQEAVTEFDRADIWGKAQIVEGIIVCAPKAKGERGPRRD